MIEKETTVTETPETELIRKEFWKIISDTLTEREVEVLYRRFVKKETGKYAITLR